MGWASHLRAALILLSAYLASAQENSGKITGTISDETGALVPSAVIVATSPKLPDQLRTVTDHRGRFVLPNVPIGIYEIAISKSGFMHLRQRGLNITLGASLAMHLVLKLGRVEETLEVTSAADPLEITSSRTSTNFTRARIDPLPKGRTFNSLLLLAPGVRYEPKNGAAGVGGIQVDGASGSENAYFIDGVEVSDLRRGSLSPQNAIPFELLQEIQVKSGGFEAEYGGATGGVVNVATRGGTNAYHAEALFAFTGAPLNSRDRGAWQVHPSDTTRPDFFAPKKDDYWIWYPGVTIGGPVPKLENRLFFSAGYFLEAERTRRTIDYSPDPANRPLGFRISRQSDTRHHAQARLDFTPSPKWQLTGSYLWSPEKIIGRLPNRDIRIAPPANDLAVQGGYRPAQAYTASVSYTASPSLLLTARYGYRYLNDKIGNYGLAGEPFLNYATPSSSAPNVPTEFEGQRGYTNVSSTLATLRDIATRRNIYLDGTWIRSIAGHQHAFKIGFSMNRVSNVAESDYTNGRFQIFWGSAYSGGTVVNQRGTYGYYLWQDGPRLNGEAHSRNLGLYAQDEWRLGRVTLHLGVRFENEFLPPFRKEIRGIRVRNPVSFGFAEKAAPRLGAAWDLRGDGRWKLSASYGFFYDVMKYELARAAFGLETFTTAIYRLDNPNVLSLSKSNPGGLGAAIRATDNFGIPINDRGELQGIDPALKPYQTREVTAALQHAFNARLTGGVRYTHRALVRAIEDFGAIDANGDFSVTIGNPGFGISRSDPRHVFDGKTPNGREFLIPQAVRQYDGAEFHLNAAWSRQFLLASYTYSRLYGNYSGTASSDESGRSAPGLSAGFDLPYAYFDSSGSQQHVLGRLGTDRPHTLKLFAAHEQKIRGGALQFGIAQTAYSGTPDSTTVLYNGSTTFPNGRGDLGRTPVLTQTDLSVHHTIRLREHASLRLEAEVRNLFNQAAVIARVSQINRAGGTITPTALPLESFFNGYTLSDYVNPANRTLAGPAAGSPAPPYLPSYGLPSGHYAGGDLALRLESSARAVAIPNWGAYQDIRTLRLGVRFLF